MKCDSPRNKNAIARRARLVGAFVFVCLGACFAEVYSVSAQAGPPQSSVPLSQAQIRAAFIFNFSKFAEWPSSAYVDAGSPLTVCFVGAEDVRTAFQSLSAGKAVTGRFVEDRCNQIGWRSTRLPARLRGFVKRHARDRCNEVPASVQRACGGHFRRFSGARRNDQARGGKQSNEI